MEGRGDTQCGTQLGNSVACVAAQAVTGIAIVKLAARALRSWAMLLDRHLLGELEVRWRAQEAPILERLTPGLSVEEIDAVTAPLGVRLPAEARLWWQWHNGVPGAKGSLRVLRTIGGPYYEYIPIEEAAA